MTAAWETFQKQYRAQGIERLDGYTPALFDGLSAPERDRAHALVLERAAAGETPEVRALPLLGTPAALRCVEGLMAREREPGLVRLAAAEAGWAMTREPAYQRAILAIVREGDDFTRARAIHALCALPLTPEALEAVTAMLRVEDDEALTVELAQGVLRSRGVAVDDDEDFQRALPLVRALAAPSLQDRGEAIASLDALIAAHRAA